VKKQILFALAYGTKFDYCLFVVLDFLFYEIRKFKWVEVEIVQVHFHQLAQVVHHDQRNGYVYLFVIIWKN
jgi:hypothetical protein